MPQQFMCKSIQRGVGSSPTDNGLEVIITPPVCRHISHEIQTDLHVYSLRSSPWSLEPRLT